MSKELFPSPSDFPKEKKEKKFKEGTPGLPHTEESEEEAERLAGGPYRRKFLGIEDIPNWFSDTGEKKEKEKENRKREEIKDAFGKLPVLVQREIIRQLESEQKINPRLNVVERANYLVDRNLKLIEAEERRKKRR
jgi:hypothetical protein